MRETSSRSSTSRVRCVDLALDDVALAADVAVAAHAHQLERGDDRRERVAQLVAEHREELVLRAARRLGGGRARLPRSTYELRAVERLLAAARDRLQERALVAVEAVRVLEPERD